MIGQFFIRIFLISLTITGFAVPAFSHLSKDSLPEKILYEASETVERISLNRLKVPLLEEISIAQVKIGDLQHADGTLQKLISVLSTDPTLTAPNIELGAGPAPQVRTLLNMARVLWHSGNVSEADKKLTKAHEQALEGRNLFMRHLNFMEIVQFYIRQGNARLANAWFQRVSEAITQLPKGQFLKDYETLLMEIRKAEIELEMEQIENAETTVTHLIERIRKKGQELSLFVRVAQLQASLGHAQQAMRTLEEVFALRHNYVADWDIDEQKRQFSRNHFMKVVDLCRVAIAQVNAGYKIDGEKTLNLAIEAVKYVNKNPQDQGVAWKSITRAAAHLGNIDLALSAQNKTKGTAFEEAALPDLFRALVQSNKLDIATEIAQKPKWLVLLARIQTELGDFRGAVKTAQLIRPEEFNRFSLEINRAISKARANIFGSRATLHWARQSKNPRTKVGFLLGIVDNYYERWKKRCQEPFS